MSSNEESVLLVERKKLKKVLSSLKEVSGTAEMDALLWQSEGKLYLMLEGSVLSLPAKGTWNGQVRLSADLLRRIDVAPGGVEADVSFASGKLTIDGVSVPATWQSDGPIIGLPADSPVLEVLKVARHHTAEDIQRSGLQTVVAQAEQRRDEILDQAEEVLAPLTINRRDIEEMLERKLQLPRQSAADLRWETQGTAGRKG